MRRPRVLHYELGKRWESMPLDFAPGDIVDFCEMTWMLCSVYDVLEEEAIDAVFGWMRRMVIAGLLKNEKKVRVCVRAFKCEMEDFRLNATKRDVVASYYPLL